MKAAPLRTHLSRRRGRLGPNRSTRHRFRPQLEVLEQHLLLTTFFVTNTNDSGPGSLRAAIDLVTFSGGVAEYVYGREAQTYGDLGVLLAQEIRARIEGFGSRLEGVSMAKHRPDGNRRGGSKRNTSGTGRCSIWRRGTCIVESSWDDARRRRGSSRLVCWWIRCWSRTPTRMQHGYSSLWTTARRIEARHPWSVCVGVTSESSWSIRRSMRVG